MYSLHLLMPIDGSMTALQVVYASHENSDERLATDLEQLVEAYNRRLHPRRLLFICPAGIEQRIKQSFDNKRTEFEGRLKEISHVVVAPYDERGKLLSGQIVRLTSHANTKWKLTDNFLKRVSTCAVGRIFKDTKAILHAPHGYLFRHLSGREEDIFIRAGNMLRDPSCLAVFNYLLLGRLPPNCSLIYIDSFTILSFALGLQSLVSYFRRSCCSISALAIENIHSYEVTSEFRPTDYLSYLVLISASTSGAFAKKIVRENRAECTRIVHLLGVGPPRSKWRDSCVYFWERLQPRSPSQQNALIEIGTEEFLVAPGPPRPVSITRAHVNRDGSRELHKLFYRKALKFGHPSPIDGGAYSTFSVSSKSADSNCEPMLSWIRNCLVHELPASVQTLIHVDDPMSTKVAKCICEALGNGVNTKSLDELKDSSCTTPSPKGSFVIVAYQDDPNLESLRESSVALRRMGDVHRHYVVGYAFPSSRAEYCRHKADLRMVRNGPRYGWSEYLVVPVGTAQVHNSLSSVASFDTNAIEHRRKTLGEGLAKALIERKERSEIPSDGLFLPCANGDPLVLRPGSVFFNTQTDNVSQIAVHAMVSAAMQKARESNEPSGFDENPFVRSVLAPNMFTRFSDGILQASLLRSAHRHELDYSASCDLSRQFMSICCSIFVSHNQDVGVAALEFVHALATEKVSLQPNDHNSLYQKISSFPVLKSFWELLDLEK